MYYIYFIESESDPAHRYIGLTHDVQARLEKHNDPAHKSKHRPWRLVMYLAFDDKDKAIAFEEFLRTPSGEAFANKRFW